jgi:hypothetical protein
LAILIILSVMAGVFYLTQHRHWTPKYTLIHKTNFKALREIESFLFPVLHLAVVSILYLTNTPFIFSSWFLRRNVLCLL